MTEQQAFEAIKTSLEQVRNQTVDINMDTELQQEKILDSLDSMVFIMDLESRTGVKFSEDLNLAEEGLFNVRTLATFLCRS